MEHVVFFTGSSGPGFRRVPDLADALASVEHLRNVAGIDDATVYALSAVPLQFRTYVKVEMAEQVAELAVPVVEPVVEPVVVPSASPASMEEFAPETDDVPVEVVAELPVPRTESPVEVVAAEAMPEPAAEAMVAVAPEQNGAVHDVLPEPAPARAGRGMGFFAR